MNLVPCACPPPEATHSVEWSPPSARLWHARLHNTRYTITCNHRFMQFKRIFSCLGFRDISRFSRSPATSEWPASAHCPSIGLQMAIGLCVKTQFKPSPEEHPAAAGINNMSGVKCLNVFGILILLINPCQLLNCHALLPAQSACPMSKSSRRVCSKDFNANHQQKLTPLPPFPNWGHFLWHLAIAGKGMSW